MNRFEEIREAVRQLPPFRREELAEWILNLGDFEDQVAEAAMEYRSTVGVYLTPEEYMRMEDDSEIRHEYIGGEAFAMSGVTVRHADIAQNVFAELRGHLGGSACRPYFGHVKVALRVDRADVYYYPDVTVARGPQEADGQFLAEPLLIVEVLSPSTQHIDRREKRLNYPLIPTVEEYLVIAQHTAQVIIHRRAEDWKPQVLTSLADVAEFRSIDFRLSLEKIYKPI